MKLAELYSEYFANWLSGGDVHRQDQMSLLGIKPLLDKWLTHQGITKVWSITSLPVEYDINITEAIRQEMFKAYPDVKTIVNIYSIPLNVNVHSRAFVENFASVSSKYGQYRSVFEQLREDEQLTGATYYVGNNARKVTITKEQLMRLKEEYDSYAYVTTAANSGAEFVHAYYFIQATFKNKKDINGYKKALAALLNGQDIFFKELHGTINDYLESFGPAAIMKGENKNQTPLLLADEGLVSLMPYHTKGLVGGEGSLIALENESKLPFMIDFFNSGSGQIVLIAAKTGYGKTFLTYPVVLEFSRQGVHVSITDFKGDEWDKILKYTSGIKVDFSPSSGSYVNVLRMDDLPVTRENATEVYNDAVMYCCNLFSIPVNLQPGEGNHQDEIRLISDAVRKVFSQAGIDVRRPETFQRSRGLEYDDVIEKLADLKNTHSYTKEQKELIDVLITRITPVFSKRNGETSDFVNEITLSDIINAPVVVYTFNKNKGSDFSSTDTIRNYMIHVLDGKKQSYRKSQKLHTVAIYEELQRTKSMPLLVEDIAHKVTGSRSNNVTIFLLTNAVGVMEDSMYAPIRSNITTKIVGLVSQKDEELLTQYYDCENIEEYVKAIRTDEKNEFQHCFAISYNTGNDANKAIIKTVVPKYLEEDFATRDKAGDL